MLWVRNKYKQKRNYSWMYFSIFQKAHLYSLAIKQVHTGMKGWSLLPPVTWSLLISILNVASSPSRPPASTDCPSPVCSTPSMVTGSRLILWGCELATRLISWPGHPRRQMKGVGCLVGVELLARGSGNCWYTYLANNFLVYYIKTVTIVKKCYITA